MSEAPAAPLLRYVPDGAALLDAGAILDRFLAWVQSTGLEPYPAQQEALLELMDGKHVVLQTPTGSGKSLVALGLHFKALCEGRRSFYTAPTKALVNEKFFALCDLFGADRVGMMTGDVSLNWAAPVVCCTQEVLSNIALRQGERADAPYVVMDEFHYYADPQRGVAWQVPLLKLPRTTFLLMSATLGNTAHIEERLRDATGRAVAHVFSDERPVPLDFDYRETPIQETVEALLEEGRAPIYVVAFTQRECADLAQALCSARVSGREHRQRLREATAEFRFDSPYGRDVKRFVSHGIGLHHAGLLPKYRLLMEQLAQKGLLRVICGTDTLGVGVNVPIRTVLLTSLAKYDGERRRLLTAREFKQITGRAGRRGFDELGSVVCQAPEHVIANKRAGGRGAKKARRPARRPPQGFVAWTEATFEQLVARPPERLVARFRVDHGMLMNVLQNEHGAGYTDLVLLIARCHDSEPRKRRLRREAAALFRSLRRAEIVRIERTPGRAGARVVVDADLQREFSLHQTLSLYLVEALSALDPDEEGHALDVLSLVEAVLENPEPILRAQVRKRKGELIARLKAERVPYEERMAKLDEVTWPKPNAEFIYATFDVFADAHPWVGHEAIRPKSIAREMVEGFESFAGYVKRYELQRIEGRLLRYLGDVYGTLMRTVPDAHKSEDVHEILAYLRGLVAHVDSSLLREWEGRLRPGAPPAAPEAPPPPPRLDLTLTPRAFRARVRTELHALVRALAEGDYAEAARWVHPDPDDAWDAERLEAEFAPFVAEHGAIAWTPSTRRAHGAVLKPTGPRTWDVLQTLPDPAGGDAWYLEGSIDLREVDDPDEALFRLRRIAS